MKGDGGVDLKAVRGSLVAFKAIELAKNGITSSEKQPYKDSSTIVLVIVIVVATVVFRVYTGVV